MATVHVYVAPDGNPLIFEDVEQMTFIDNESHGVGPVGRLDALPEGGSRLIVSSPNVLAVLIEHDA